ncbi:MULTISPECIES: hypothetical protein [unclassified Paenibacillus]|uniref:hypothetical protein n=1 Tax=unclassified Paenibacillus TaxID=185978 RepID=UPI001AE8C8F7|nr:MULTISPECIES: hypothetical protein [unclassified Paenibacillus]MBP1156188.1 hypothetical protein [Paenibacillus sp. PvP091]MBP1168426.1 hypothetical protein [Paenibacillus sp. PvR098]MBP2439454.1 hypothetical protein [Paenibacillus sp. PvP052]
MSRTIEFTETSLILNLNGLKSLAALRRKVEIPYSAIQKVNTEDFKISLLSFRVGTSIFDIRQGRFMLTDKWSFISYENHKDVIVLTLNNHEFEKVVFQIHNPEEVKNQIIERITG